MRTCALLFTLMFLGLAITANAQIVGDLKSSDNDLSWMISVSGLWDGTNADIGGQLGEDLPRNTPATVTFKQGRFSAGTYRGWLHKGDYVFYQVDEVVPCHGEYRRILRAGRCGNPASGRYFVPKPQTPAPPPVCAPPPKPVCQPPPKPCPPPVVCCPPYPAPVVRCSTVVNLTTNVNVTVKQAAPRRQAPTLTPLGATTSVVQTRGGTIGGGVVSIPAKGEQKLCPPYPDKPITPPPAPPSPPVCVP